MKSILTLVLLTVTIRCYGQQSQKFNLDFEVHSDSSDLSDGWTKWGNYDLTIDTISYNGRRSGKIVSSPAGNSFGSLAYKIPANYSGRTIHLEGYMKTVNVWDGFAGLLLRIDGNGQALAFDNMQQQNITGTNDWKKYNITLDYPAGAEHIFVAGILVGKGEAWFDNFVLTIDGESVQTLKETPPKVLKAQTDREFDRGSLVDIPDLSPEIIDNLELLGRVWGFLKYHHPEISKGNYNWDYELFRFIPEYILADNLEKRDKILIQWIDSLGVIERCTTCESTDINSFLKPDHNWIEDQGQLLSDKLISVYKNRSQGKQYYFARDLDVGKPKFRHESAYSIMPYPDKGYRLLSLYRYWNMINYFFPYKYLTDTDWNLVLKKYIPTFLSASSELEYEFAVLQLIGEVRDTHANLWAGADKVDTWKGQYFAPIHVRFIEGQLVVTDYYDVELMAEVQLKIGDIITKIDGVGVDKIVRERSKYYPASNIPTMLRDLSADLLRSNNSQMMIDYKSSDLKEQKVNLHLYPKDSIETYWRVTKSSGKSYKVLDGNIGYVTLNSIKDSDVSEIREQFKNTTGIVIDIRGYPSAYVPYSLGSYFVSNATPFVKFTILDLNNPGEFEFGAPLEIPGNVQGYSKKLVVIVNEHTQSQAEYTAMAFRAGENTTVIGSTTAGADGNVSSLVLPGGLRTSISGIGVYYPNGDETQRVGIVPDLVVKPTVDGIREGKDELLEAAVKLILKN